MPVFAIAAPLVAIGFAASSVAAVGITTASVFAITAAVGATVAAVGHFTGVKELKIAGTILGAIGGIGSLAAGAGLFGAEGLFGLDAAAAAGQVGGAVGEAGGAVAQAGDVASDVTALAGDISNVGPPAGGYTIENIANSGLEGSLAGFEPATGAMPTGETDIINLVNGAGVENFNPLTPAEGVAQAQTVAPAAEVLPKTTIAATDVQPPGLVDSVTSPEFTQAGLDVMPRDEFGNIITQGGGEGTPLGNVTNPGQPVDSTTLPVNASGTGAGTTPTSTAPITGQAAPTSGVGLTPQQAASNALINAPPISGTIAKADPGIWSNILGFVKDNPMLSFGALQGATSFISGAFAPDTTEEQRRAYEAQAQQNLAAANLTRTQDELLQRRLRNMSQPMPVARLGGQPPGLINTMPAITGRPA